MQNYQSKLYEKKNLNTTPSFYADKLNSTNESMYAPYNPTAYKLSEQSKALH